MTKTERKTITGTKLNKMVADKILAKEDIKLVFHKAKKYKEVPQLRLDFVANDESDEVIAEKLANKFINQIYGFQAKRVHLYPTDDFKYSEEKEDLDEHLTVYESYFGDDKTVFLIVKLNYER